MSFYWIFANAFQIWSTLDGYEKLANEFKAISNGLKHVPATFLGICTCVIGEMVKKASKRLYFLIGNKSAIMSRRPELLRFYTSFIRSVYNYAIPVFHTSLPPYLIDDLALSIICPT